MPSRLRQLLLQTGRAVAAVGPGGGGVRVQRCSYQARAACQPTASYASPPTLPPRGPRRQTQLSRTQGQLLSWQHCRPPTMSWLMACRHCHASLHQQPVAMPPGPWGASSWPGRGGGASHSDSAPNALTFRVTLFNEKGDFESKHVRKSELLFDYGMQNRDIRFSKFSSLYVRASSIVLHLQHIKAIINHDSLLLLDSEHPAIVEFLPELQERLREREDSRDSLPFELRAVEALLMKMFSVLVDRLRELEPALREILNSLLDPRLFSVDRGELHILLHHSKTLSEFHSLVRDIEGTLTDMLDVEEDMADMYLTHLATTGEDRDPEDTEEANNILEAYLMQAENVVSEVRQLQELVERSEGIILINLDSQRNIMLRLGLQLEMGMFSATFAGLFGMAFGMNLESSLEENPYAFWVITGLMLTVCGLLWRKLLTFLGKNLQKTPFKRVTRSKRK